MRTPLFFMGLLHCFRSLAFQEAEKLLVRGFAPRGVWISKAEDDPIAGRTSTCS